MRPIRNRHIEIDSLIISKHWMRRNFLRTQIEDLRRELERERTARKLLDEKLAVFQKEKATLEAELGQRKQKHEQENSGQNRLSELREHAAMGEGANRSVY